MSMQPEWHENPFATCLRESEAAFRNIRSEPHVYEDARIVPEFVKIYEDRQFVFDVVARVQSLASAYDRLHELSELYRALRAREDELIDQQREDGCVNFDIPDEIFRGENRCRFEAQALVAFVYYEISTLVNILRGWFQPMPNSELAYLVGVRHKLLAHPLKGGRTKNSGGTLSSGPILHTHLVGGECWIPLVRNHYLAQLGLPPDMEDDEQAGELANRKLLLSTKKVEKFSPEEVLGLKAYVIREPDLMESAHQIAALLETNFVPHLRDVCTAAACVKLDESS